MFTHKSDFRSSILDRNKNIITQSVITTNVGIDPKLVIDKKKLLINLKIIFPNKNFNEISKKLDGNKFFYLEKKISMKKHEQLFYWVINQLRKNKKFLEYIHNLNYLVIF